MEQNLKICPLCGKKFDENADDYGFDMVVDGKDCHIRQIKLSGGEIIEGLCSQCLKAAAYGCCVMQDDYGNKSWRKI
jgi:hypothetical protein